eukprot:CAMPEP_0171198714 /NCGR_PEP_ID=MMETSP0790-20130122/23086_1 /TAXON_ID=2925 /ORGANISM="Alexandrium catenella, Strain OF101" /LENGTH=51 /DNA_ID=CAMNT_0011664029 /DNA_START=59 /DNA_END=211 /DNA_ORIENTATION=+
MALRTVTPIVLCALVAALVFAGAWSFVGGSAGARSGNLRASQRAPDVAMNF